MSFHFLLTEVKTRIHLYSFSFSLSIASNAHLHFLLFVYSYSQRTLSSSSIVSILALFVHMKCGRMSKISFLLCSRSRFIFSLSRARSSLSLFFYTWRIDECVSWSFLQVYTYIYFLLVAAFHFVINKKKYVKSRCANSLLQSIDLEESLKRQKKNLFFNSKINTHIKRE